MRPTAKAYVVAAALGLVGVVFVVLFAERRESGISVPRNSVESRRASQRNSISAVEPVSRRELANPAPDTGAPDQERTEGRALEVSVREKGSGMPLAGAMLDVYRQGDEGGYLGSWRTGDDGVARIAISGPGHYFVWADYGSGSPEVVGVVVADGGRAVVDVRIDISLRATIKGVVVDGDGSVVVGASVSSHAVGARGERWQEDAGRSGIDGGFALHAEAVATTLYEVRAAYEGMSGRVGLRVVPGHEVFAGPVMVGADGGTIRGSLARIGDGMREPIGGALVRLGDGAHRSGCCTDAEGAFEFTGLAPGSYVLDVDRWCFVEPAEPVAVAIETPGQERSVGVITCAPPSQRIRGRVVDQYDQPVNGARVVADPNVVRTAGDGTFDVPTCGPVEDLTITHGMSSDMLASTFHGVPADGVERVYRLVRSGVRLVLIDADSGMPISRRKVSVEGASGELRFKYQWRVGGHVVRLAGDCEGGRTWSFAVGVEGYLDRTVTAWIPASIESEEVTVPVLLWRAR